MFGRNSECPLAIVAPCSPSDCFTMIQEAFRIAVEFMTPVIFLSDGYVANGAEPWRIPDASALKPINVQYLTESNGNGQGVLPYKRIAVWCDRGSNRARLAWNTASAASKSGIPRATSVTILITISIW